MSINAMMQPFIFWPILTLIGYVLYQKIGFQLRRRRFEKIHGCLPAAKLPQIERTIGVDILIENLRCFNKKCLLARLKQRFEQFGNTYSVTIAGMSMIYTIEPENIKAVFGTQFDDFDVGWQRRRVMAPTTGEFLLNADGASWHHYRAMLRPAFARRQTSTFGTFKHGIDDLLCTLPRDGSTVDLSPLFYKLALALGTRLLFDETMGSLNPEFKNNSMDFIRAFHTVNRGVEIRVRMGLLLPLMPRNRLYDDANRVLHNYADAFVRKALEYRKFWDSSDADSSEKPNERYVFLHELAKENEDPIRLRDHLLGMLLAGSETTASLLTSCLSILSHRRTLWAELRAEVLEMQDQEPNYERVKALTKLTYFINEVLRLYPTIPMYNRIANKDTTLPTGGGPDGKSKIFIPKNSFVATNTHSLHRRKDLYGPDAENFRPGRWATLKSQGNWAYLPFSGGPRICIGQQFALMEVSYTLVRLLQEFKGIESRDAEPWLEKIGVSYTNGNGAKVSLIPA